MDKQDELDFCIAMNMMLDPEMGYEEAVEEAKQWMRDARE